MNSRNCHSHAITQSLHPLPASIVRYKKSYREKKIRIKKKLFCTHDAKKMIFKLRLMRENDISQLYYTHRGCFLFPLIRTFFPLGEKRMSQKRGKEEQN